MEWSELVAAGKEAEVAEGRERKRDQRRKMKADRMDF